MEIQLVEDMEIRNVTRDDLPKLAEIISCEELITREDICFEHSKLMTDDNDMIVSFVIIRRYSLNEFFNGEIPLYKCEKDSKDYKEGDEHWLIEMIDEHFMNDNQYEMETIYVLTHRTSVLILFVIPQDKANSIRNVACEPVYTESPLEFVFHWRFRIAEQYYAPRPVSRYCSNLRNDRSVSNFSQLVYRFL